MRTVEFEDTYIIIHLYSVENLDELKGWETLYAQFLTEERDHPKFDLTGDDPTIVFSFEKNTSSERINRNTV